MMLISNLANADCWYAAAARYGISPSELAGIACVESGLRPHAYRAPVQGELPDIGLMQINATHLPALRQFGIRREHLEDACVSIMLGAWILSETKKRYGDTWEAVGAYNAACTKLKGADCQRVRAQYAWRVQRAMRRLAEKGTC